MPRKRVEDEHLPTRIMLPGGDDTVDKIIEERAKLWKKSEKVHLTQDEAAYGHAIGVLGQYTQSAGSTEEERKNLLKTKAEALIAKYGDQIINVMAPELLEAIGIEVKK
jgi:hypothetical protein